MNKAKLKTFSMNQRRDLIEYYMVLILYYLDAMGKNNTYENILIAQHKVKSLRVRLKRVIEVHLNNDKYKEDHIKWLKDKLIKLGQTSDSFLDRFVRNIINPNLTFECEFTFSYGDQVVHIKV